MRSGKAYLRLCLIALLLGFTPFSNAAEFNVMQAAFSTVNNFYSLDAKLEYEFSEESLEALANGIALTINVEVVVKRKRKYFWDRSVARVIQGYRLERHELTNQYLVIDISAGTQRNFGSLEEAISAMEEIGPIPVVELSALDSATAYRAQIKASLDIEELPPPLRPIAYVSPGWRLSSKWYRWGIERE